MIYHHTSKSDIMEYIMGISGQGDIYEGRTLRTRLYIKIKIGIYKIISGLVIDDNL